jgi:hypothetical protein
MRHYLYEGFSWFVAAYRTAAEKLQKGEIPILTSRWGVSRQRCRSSAGRAEQAADPPAAVSRVVLSNQCKGEVCPEG